MGVNGGTIGGAMVKRMIEQAEREMEEANRARAAAAYPEEDREREWEDIPIEEGDTEEDDYDD